MEFKCEACLHAKPPLARQHFSSFVPGVLLDALKCCKLFFILCGFTQRNTEFPRPADNLSVGKLANARARASPYLGNNSVTFCEAFRRHALPVATPGAERTSLVEILLATEFFEGTQ